ncbi:unnamed protein product [Paramecium octaurelia]|uniref:Protein kinase domain-containing protein n=1 Tax=Paramecium octaurelia TaxID=43137 RepID=A0A8S1VL65_PAROT|nr:unnamed protein product [Paramecium octaurelia]
MQQIPNLEKDDFIENFKVKSELGKGSYGAVYQVIDPNGQEYALKCMYTSRFNEVNGYVGNLIQNEVEALKKLQSQYIVKLISTFYSGYQGESLFCMLLEYCDGGNLLEYLLREQDTFTQQNAIIFFKQILQGMKEIHQKRIIHRDLKLANILIHQDQIKIADFGFCHILNSDTSQINVNLGTLGTQAPEVLDDQPYGLKSDMFSIGVIFYQLLFIAYPFSVKNQETFQNEVSNLNPPSFSKNGRKVEKYLEELLTEMLRKDPAKRLDWTDLFKSKLFQNSYSQMFLSTIDDAIDPVQSYIFYQQQYLDSNVKTDKKKTTYLDLESQISFLTYIQEFSYKVYHRQILMCLFPCFLMYKLLYKKQMEHQDYNQKMVYDLTNTHQILTYQHQVVMANHDKLKKLKIIQQNWELEIINLSLSSQFQNIFSEALLKYLLILRQEILKDTEEYKIDWQQILIFQNHTNNEKIHEVLQKIKFFVLIHKVLSLETLEKEVVDQLLSNNTQNNYLQVVYIYQSIKLG